ncbi:MAG: serine O-acetyltransferase EpsC [Polyangiaceae bacterium]
MALPASSRPGNGVHRAAAEPAPAAAPAAAPAEASSRVDGAPRGVEIQELPAEITDMAEPTSADGWGLRKVVGELRSARRAFEATRGRQCGRSPLPSREALMRVVAGLRAILFPAHFGPPDLTEDGVDFFVGHTLDRTLALLHEQVLRGLLFERGGCERDACVARAAEVMRAFTTDLPRVRDLLETDVRAAYEGDPAATSPDEAIFCYPGITAIMHQRLAHVLYREHVPLIPRILTEIAHADTGIDIHPGARIGASFFIDHGTGVVIGETCEIGRRVRLFQGVTLGAKKFPLDEEGHPVKGIPRHPIVEDDVVIYAGATILGRVTIGRASSIGGNVWLTRTVPPGSKITQGQLQREMFGDGTGI